MESQPATLASTALEIGVLTGDYKNNQGDYRSPVPDLAGIQVSCHFRHSATVEVWTRCGVAVASDSRP